MKAATGQTLQPQQGIDFDTRCRHKSRPSAAVNQSGQPIRRTHKERGMKRTPRRGHYPLPASMSILRLAAVLLLVGGVSARLPCLPTV